MVRKYRESDFEQVQQWGKAWGQDYDKDLLSPLGFIVPGVACYFIYETPSKACWLENMISNPEVPKEVRAIALDAVVTETLREVKRLGYKVAYATTDNQVVVDRAVKHGAGNKPDQTLLTLKFN